ncbi:MAG: hypothetical protein J0L93_02970 [Deltaproteobacteria bacterium]|nr:hypothetical protein [Deltaproteobacteria bacterium]
MKGGGRVRHSQQVSVFLFYFFSFLSISFTSNAQIRALNEADSLRLAKAWAPILYHDVDATYRNPETGFIPADEILKIDFDGNEDLRDNGANVFQLSTDRQKHLIQNPALYFSIVETESHYYLNYMVYHALDTNAWWHTHDTENFWVVVQKDHSPYGKFIAAISNAHGYGMIYSDNPQRQRQWRNNLIQDYKIYFLPLLDEFSWKHNLDRYKPEFVERKSGSKAMKLFVTARSHALYKFNTQAWMNRGPVYLPEDCDDCDSDIENASVKQKDIRHYELVNWDQLMTNLRKRSSENIFASNLMSPSVLTNGYRLVKNLPHYFAPPTNQEKPTANLFYETSFKTPMALLDPVALHTSLASAEEQHSISSVYLHNVYLARAPNKIAPQNILALLPLLSLR